MAAPLKKRFEAKFQKSEGCWNWTGALGTGKGESRYGQIKHQGKTLRAHVVSYQLHKGEVPDGLCVCHSCDNPRCVNPGHLFLGTHLVNMHDMYAKGRRKAASGERNGQAKLTDEERELVRVADAPTEELALYLGVSARRINQIRRAAAASYQGT